MSKSIPVDLMEKAVPPCSRCGTTDIDRCFLSATEVLCVDSKRCDELAKAAVPVAIEPEKTERTVFPVEELQEIPLTPEQDREVSLMQDEMTAMIEAWSDRGIGPRDSAEVMVGFSSAILARLGCPLDELQAAQRMLWQKYGRKLTEDK